MTIPASADIGYGSTRMTNPARARLPLAVRPRETLHIEAVLGAVEHEQDTYRDELFAHGALLFRGLPISSLDEFARFVTAFSGTEERFGYAGGASPRKGLGKAGVYSSTEYPPHMPLSLHNELSYADVYPKRLFFFCMVAPEHGGETTLGDSRRILKRIDRQVVERFRSRQIRYVRNLSPEMGSGYSWQEALETDDPAEAEACCRRIGSDFEWRADGTLRMSQVRPATAVHPETGEEIWFNQADGFHPSVLAPETYAEMLAFHGSEDEFRLGVSYGDGAPIEREALDHIRSVLSAETIPHRWQAGDIIVLDNLLAAHGRMPFRGARKIALAMV